jgi:hypothetical protein
MRSIQRRFNEIRLKNHNFSTYMSFARSIRDQKFSKDMISRWFNKLVDEDDYNKRDKKTLLDYLFKLSNGSEDNQK